MDLNGTPAPATFVGLAAVAYHRQDESDYCGPAVVQGVLDSVSAPFAQQQALFGQIVSDNDPPNQTDANAYGIAGTLNQALPSMTFAPLPAAALVTVLEQMLPTLSVRVPVPLLVDEGGDGHWITVSGVAIDENGSSSQSAGLYVNDPAPQSTDYTSMDHTTGDSCGDGGAAADQSADGITNQYWTLAGFQIPYSSPQGGFIAVAIAGANGARAPRTRSQLAVAPPRGAGTGLPDGWQQLLVDALTANGITSPGAPLAAFLGNDVWPADGPQTVSMPPFGTFFQATLLPAQGSPERPIGYALINGEARLLGVQAAAKSWQGPTWPSDFKDTIRMLEDDAVENALLRRVMQDAERGSERLGFELFWKRCRESPSPFFPLLRITLGKTVIYRSLDGRYHRTLHTLHGSAP